MRGKTSKPQKAHCRQCLLRWHSSEAVPICRPAICCLLPMLPAYAAAATPQTCARSHACTCSSYMRPRHQTIHTTTARTQCAVQTACCRPAQLTARSDQATIYAHAKAALIMPRRPNHARRAAAGHCGAAKTGSGASRRAPSRACARASLAALLRLLHAHSCTPLRSKTHKHLAHVAAHTRQAAALLTSRQPWRWHPCWHACQETHRKLTTHPSMHARDSMHGHSLRCQNGARRWVRPHARPTATCTRTQQAHAGAAPKTHTHTRWHTRGHT
jgi:hypothetical protein